MDKIPPKPKKAKKATKEELLTLDKNELIERIMQLEVHNNQLKNIISKNFNSDSDCEEKRKRQFDYSKCHYRKVLLRIMYFGWDYQGLAVQEDTNQTIEHHLFHALTKSCLIANRKSSQYHRCGRTDKGVSSFGQVISIALRSKFPPEQQYLPDSISSEMPYCKILNRLLPKEIRAVAWMPVPQDRPDLSARFDCKKRKYKYYFPRANLDISAMRAACAHIRGSHDFRHLCKMDVGNGVTEFRRDIVAADVFPVGTGDGGPMDMYNLVIEGNAFLWHQIRCIMGVLLLVGQGHEQPEIMTALLNIEKYPRKPQYGMALDVPLNLFQCYYDVEGEWVYERHELRSTISHLQNEWTIENVKTTMIRDTIEQLEQEYEKLQMREREESERVVSHAECLIQGVKSRVYKPLLERQTCSSLEERIEHYKKKRKTGDDSEAGVAI